MFVVLFSSVFSSSSSFSFSSFLVLFHFLILVFYLKQKHEKGQRLFHNLQKTNTALEAGRGFAWRWWNYYFFFCCLKGKEIRILFLIFI